jgi:hypothetical protein
MKHWTELFTEDELIIIAHLLLDRIENNLATVVEKIKLDCK